MITYHGLVLQTKDSISLADDEEQRDAYKKLFKEFAMNSQKLTLDDFKQEFGSLPGEPARDQCVAFYSLANAKKNRYTSEFVAPLTHDSLPHRRHPLP